VRQRGRGDLSVTPAQAAAFRLARHRLIDNAAPAGARAPLADLVGDTAGIQAQVQSSAELAIWTRRRQTTMRSPRNKSSSSPRTVHRQRS